MSMSAVAVVDGTSVPVSFPRRLEGKVALITGGAAGAGEATARLFVRHAAKVVIVDIRDDLGRAVAASIGPDDVVSYVHCDVSVEDDVRRAVDFAVAKYGGLDVMFNNAGVVDSIWSPITDVTTPGFEHVLSVNVTGVFLGTKHAARAMLPTAAGGGRGGGGGCIINNASVSSVVGGVASHAYVASKHAVVGLTKNTAAELGRHGIRVNCVSPFMYASSLSINEMREDAKGIESLIGELASLKGTTLRAEDVAEAVLFLASDESKYVSGHNFVLDGGFTAARPVFGLFN